MEEQRRLGTVVTPGGAISRGALEKGYGGIVAAYMMSLFNERCNGRGGGGGAYSMPARTGKTHHTRMSRSPGQQCLYARYMIWICRGGESPTAGVAIARDDGVIMG